MTSDPAGEGPGLAIESATAHVEVLVCGEALAPLAHEIEEVGHGHTRRLTPLVRRALERAGVAAGALRWIAADLGPGSFTGVRVGLATARALSLAAGATVLGAPSLTALALASEARRALIVPLVPAGRADAYAGFFRADGRGTVTLLAAPRVGPLEAILAAIDEARAAAGLLTVRCVGPGVPRWSEALERSFPGAATARRSEGLSALDLAAAVCSDRGPAAGLTRAGEEPQPLYVRSAQAEERVRRRAARMESVTLRELGDADIAPIAAIEREIFFDPWPESFFRGELKQPLVYARVAERSGKLAGYSVSWLGAGSGHLGNLAVVPDARRRGVASVLLSDLLERARALKVESLTLEVRASNFAAQALYRVHGFRLAGFRRRYYRDTGEDALLMEWRDDPRP